MSEGSLSLGEGGGRGFQFFFLMALKYRIAKSKNPSKNAVEGTTYYANKAVKTNDYTFDELAKDINDSTTITEADAYAVLKSMKKYITKALLAGRRVVLADLGALKLSLRSRCFSQDTMAASDFAPSAMIKGIAVNFRPESKLITELRANVQYERIVEE